MKIVKPQIDTEDLEANQCLVCVKKGNSKTGYNVSMGEFILPRYRIDMFLEENSKTLAEEEKGEDNYFFFVYTPTGRVLSKLS